MTQILLETHAHMFADVWVCKFLHIHACIYACATGYYATARECTFTKIMQGHLRGHIAHAARVQTQHLAMRNIAHL